MDRWIAAFGVIALLLVIAWRMPGHRILVAAVAALAVIVMIVWLEQSGFWPDSWRR